MAPWYIHRYSMLFHLIIFVLCSLNILQLCILIELLPLSGLPLESLVVGVSVLPSNLVTTKPRLCIKALTSDPKAKS